MNAAIAGGVGLLLGVVTVVGGVSAYKGDPEGVAKDNLYSYATD